jgi:hypothetical protein
MDSLTGFKNMPRKSRKKLNMDSKVSEYKGLSKSDKEYLLKFNREFEHAMFDKKDNLLDNNSEAISEAHRNHNSRYRDLLSVLENEGKVNHIEDHITEDEFMRDAHDEFGWQDVYRVRGFEDAFIFIVEQVERDLDNKFLNRQITLGKFLNKYMALRRVDARRKNQDEAP